MIVENPFCYKTREYIPILSILPRKSKAARMANRGGGGTSGRDDSTAQIKDREKRNVAESQSIKGAVAPATSSIPPSTSPMVMLCLALQQLQQGVQQQDDRPISRMLRQLKNLRAKVSAKHLGLAADHLLWSLAPNVFSEPGAACINADSTKNPELIHTNTHVFSAADAALTVKDAPTVEGLSVQQQQQTLRVILDAETQEFWRCMRSVFQDSIQAEEKSTTDEATGTGEDPSAPQKCSAGAGAASLGPVTAGTGIIPLQAADFLSCMGEVEVFLSLLLLLRLLDAQRYDSAARLGDALMKHVIFVEERGVTDDPLVVLLPPASSNGAERQNASAQGVLSHPARAVGSSTNMSSGTACSAAAAAVLQQQAQGPRRRRRRLDLIAAKCAFYWYRARELQKTLNQQVRRDLLRAYTVASVQHDRMTQATTLNLLLRDYISHDQYELALKLVAKTSFPEHLRSNAQHARYLYYLGSIQAVRLEYSAAFAKLQMALRRAPQQPRLAAGFRLAVLKKAVVVELLMGDIPERATFNRKETRAALLPFKHIVLAVRSGDLHAFAEVMKRYEKTFIKDSTLFLIRRLHHNVIRTGLRLISLSYSRISLADVAQKLGLESAAYAEGIVAKAILDGVIEATIDHERQFVESKANAAIYLSSEPQKAFNKRIAFCLQLHADAVRAMQYPEIEEARDRKDDDADERRKALQEEMARVEDEDIGEDDLDLL